MDYDWLMTPDEAFSFMQGALCMTSPKEKYGTNRELFLQELIMAWFHHIPFQTVSNITTPRDQRHLPTLPEIKGAIFAKRGGICYDLNVCFYVILRTIGLDVYLAHGLASPGNDHPVIIVRNLTEDGSKHLVDVGGFATFRAIPLDFDRESPEYHDGFLSYKLLKENDVIMRLHRYSSDRQLAESYPGRVRDGWFYFFTIYFSDPVDISHFAETIGNVYTKILPEPMPPFLSSLRCLAFPNGRFVCIKDSTLLVENEKGQVQKTYLKSRDEVIEAFARYFPQFSRGEINTAIDDENIKLDFNKTL